MPLAASLVRGQMAPPQTVQVLTCVPPRLGTRLRPLQAQRRLPVHVFVQATQIPDVNDVEHVLGADSAGKSEREVRVLCTDSKSLQHISVRTLPTNVVGMISSTWTVIRHSAATLLYEWFCICELIVHPRMGLSVIAPNVWFLERGG